MHAPSFAAEQVRRLRSVIGAALASGAVSIAGCGSADAPAEASFTVLSEPAAAHSGPPAPDPALWKTPLDDPLLEQGRKVWTGTCIACHSNGLGGAPLIGNRELWGPRLDQGLETLVRHATEGFYGKKGEMPARGGNAELTDEQVRAAVHFMASRAVTSGGS